MSDSGRVKRVKPYNSPRMVLSTIVLTLSVLAVGCGTESDAHSEVGNDVEVVSTESMSSAELADFAAQKLSTVFNQKATVEITVEADFLAAFSIFAPDQTEIDEMMAAEGVSRDDTLITFRTVNYFDGVNTMTRSTTEMPTFGESPETSDEMVTLDIAGVVFVDETVNVGPDSDEASESWLRIDPGVDGESADNPTVLFSALRQLAFENVEDVIDHGTVESDGVSLRRLTAIYRGAELLGGLADQQSSAAMEDGGAYGEQMKVIQQYVKDHVVTEFEIFLDEADDVRTIHFSSYVDAEEEYQDCRWFTASAGTHVTVTFTEFPGDLVISAPPIESVTTWDERMSAAQQLELPEQDMADLEKFLEESQGVQDELQAEMDEMLRPAMALCPGA